MDLGPKTFEPDLICGDCGNSKSPVSDELYVGCKLVTPEYTDQAGRTRKGYEARCSDVRGTSSCVPVAGGIAHRIMNAW